MPNDLLLVNREYFAQGAFLDVGGTPAADVRLSNGLRIQVGAP